MGSRYAKRTDVPVGRTKVEIERTLKNYGADQFFTGWTEDRAFIACRMYGVQLRFPLTLPGDMTAQQERAKWRVLLLSIKSKLESIEAGIEQPHEAFLANIMLPNQQTYGQLALPQIQKIYETNKMPPLLPWGGN